MLRSRLVRFAAVAALGLAALVAGLVWDAAMHSADAELAMKEGVFTLGNPAHLLFVAGVFLLSAGAAGVIALVVRSVPRVGAGNRRSSLPTRVRRGRFGRS